MKKILLTTALGLFLSSAGYAVNPVCTYTQDQEIIRSAEYIADVAVLGNDTNRINAVNPCGGSLLQLAILRNNPDIIKYLLENGADTNALISIKGYEADFDPKTPADIPVLLFAARYIAHGDTLQVLLNHELDARIVDANGHDIFWYFNQNPALRESYITKGGVDQLVSYKKMFGSETPLDDGFE